MLNMAVFLALTAGLVLSFAITSLMRPRLPAPWRWAWQGIVLHVGLWVLTYALLVLVLGRPWFAVAVALAFLMLLVQVSNAKFDSLREAFVFQDFEYFTDAIRHPRLYIPFLGWWKFSMIVVGVIAALSMGFLFEASPPGRFALDAQLGEAAFFLLAGVVLVLLARRGPTMRFEPAEDMRQLGFLGCLCRYGQAERSPIGLPHLFDDAVDPVAERPDLVVVQSESFFDPRPLFAGIRPDILAAFDRLSTEAIKHGGLVVPAWGANTVRSEFAFLSGASEEMLGVHRFNPYRQILNSEVATLSKVLKRAGYRTVCVHPYHASFYGRDKVFPHLGFDEFVDIRSFMGAERVGYYVSDRALAAKIRSLIASAETPIFVFAITMENHGPLHLEKPEANDLDLLYTVKPPDGCDDLTVYLRHLKNADAMAEDLREFLLSRHRRACFCWYGDHVPIMSDVYRQLGDPDGESAYFIWSNRPGKSLPESKLRLNLLASSLLDTLFGI